ncbi:DNA polymerase III subunit gamma/tau [Undibacterium cyanobacteriorum]|uniref:DNA-directed DNA polymerase n=1 Tax=Undibacterium cyanobacteriorum TaxID=3073561 RepID=A0ABY9REL3_9BURK|nr:DNA polymerase III subunit gamma/tau [Undibacterium sp. 20NA77.5]WMW79104.1 DNA polymerase III subunit gamma/tau [Undibacterium sp. 20NA77.5]
MSYQVLARKYRPKSFATLVGQEHVVRALTHALDQQRLHHAYLFTGTRGVGKTTLSRILAKSFNCEKGITSQACGECEACTAIDAGRYVDYIEMDAASNRGVDEMASLLEQAIYAPSNARFKVYMIDEVHMLTNHAFNAMLKTLEEPPPHIKFILATTDPQKIPVTVLSRCLQFNLKQMPPGHIVGHLENILGQERIEFEQPALRLLAQGAHGSMRDALSLTDQAIAYAAGKVSLDSVQSMLGALDQSYLIRLLQALLEEDGSALLTVADEMAARSLSYKSALQDLATMLHQIAVAQMVPNALAEDVPERAALLSLAEHFGKEEVQLYYQIAVHGRNEIGLAPDEYSGFSMTLLRMLAFRPSKLPPLSGGSGGGSNMPPPSNRGPSNSGIHSAREAMQAAKSAAVAGPAVVRPQLSETVQAPQSIAVASEAIDRPRIVADIVADSALQIAPQVLPVEASRIIDEVPNRSAVKSTSPSQSNPQPDEFAGIRLPPVIAKTMDSVSTAETPKSGKLSPAMAALAAARAASGKPAATPIPSQSSNAETTMPVAQAVTQGQARNALVEPTVKPHDPSPVVAHDRDTNGATKRVTATGLSKVEDEVMPPWEEADFEGVELASMPPLKQKDFDESEYFQEASSLRVEEIAASSSAPSVNAPAQQVQVPSVAAAPQQPLQLMPVSEIGWDGHWPNLAASLPVKGVAQQLAQQSELRQVSLSGGAVVFRLCVPVQTLLSAGSVDKLLAALCDRFADSGHAIRIETEIGAVEQTANAQALAEKAARQQFAERAIQEDGFVQNLMREFGASLLAGSVRPI